MLSPLSTLNIDHSSTTEQVVVNTACPQIMAWTIVKWIGFHIYTYKQIFRYGLANEQQLFNNLPHWALTCMCNILHPLNLPPLKQNKLGFVEKKKSMEDSNKIRMKLRRK